MEHSIGLIREVLKDRLKDDYFGDIFFDHIGPNSIRQFIEFMSAGNVAMRESGAADRAKFPDLTDMNMTFNDFLNSAVKLKNGTSESFRDIFAKQLCTSLVGPLAAKVAHEEQFRQGDADAFREANVDSWSSWATAMSRDNLADRTATAIYEECTAALKDRTLLSFFVKPTPPGEFVMWGPRASSGQGRKLPKRVIAGDSYSVEVKVSRYEEVDGPVTAYEWQATLTVAGGSAPDAAACGMVYVFDRANGEPTGDLDDLVMAADSMTDDDVLQVKSFIRQHPDASEIIENSDLCFVWIWEKRGGAPKGLGAKCLIAGLADLRRRFKKVRTAIFDVRPTQFVDWTAELEPPAVAVEKQTAIENLVQYIESVPVNYTVRVIFNRSKDPFNDALLALGEASMARFGPPDDDDDDGVGIDVDLWRDELIELFGVAGLDELAADLEEGDEVQIVVETALRHLVFDAHVHYLRVPNIEDLSVFAYDDRNELPVEMAMARVEGFEEFRDSLPNEMEVESTFFIGDCFICEVVASTPFGNLLEYFTLVPKPRPMDIQKFFLRYGD